MRLQVVSTGVPLLLGLVIAQAQTTPDLHLRGDRFQPLTYDKLTPEQKIMADHLLSGERGGLNGPFNVTLRSLNVTLRSPEMGDLAQKLGAQLRFHSSLPKRLNELAILMTARFWTAQYEWSAHRRSALAAGLDPVVIDAIAAGRRPVFKQPDEEIVYNFARDLLTTKQVSDAAFRAAADKFGERGVVDLTGIMGYYCLVSMMLNIDRNPLPDEEKPELKPLP